MLAIAAIADGEAEHAGCRQETVVAEAVLVAGREAAIDAALDVVAFGADGNVFRDQQAAVGQDALDG